MKHPLVRLSVLVVGSLMCIGLVRSIFENLQRTDLVAERKTALHREEEKNAALRDRLREATSASFIEQQARNKLGLVRDGDTVVIVGSQQSSGDTNRTGTADLTRWERWMKLFF